MRVRGKGEEKNQTGTEQGRKADEGAKMALMWTHITIPSPSVTGPLSCQPVPQSGQTASAPRFRGSSLLQI